MLNLIDDTMTFKPEAIRALREFKALRTGRGSDDDRLAGMQTLIDALASAYEVRCPVRVVARDINGGFSGNSSVRLMEDVNVPPYFLITMTGKLSIITLLHEFAHIRFNSGNQVKVQKWAVNLFRKVYPRQFEQLTQDVDGYAFTRG